MKKATIPADNRAEENWDQIILPENRWFDLRLKELWNYRDLVYLFIRRDLAAQYKQTLLGPLWLVINPLIATVIFTIVFGNIAQLSTDGLPKILFYLSGTTLWQFFAHCLTMTATTFTSNAEIFGKVYFPRLSVPLSVVCSQLLRLAIQLAVFLAFWVFFFWRGADIQITAQAWLFPLLLLIMLGLSLGMGIIISSITTKYRDLTNLIGYIVQMAMYAAPVVYPMSMLEGSPYRLLIWLNPMTPVIETFREGFLGEGMVAAPHLAYSAGTTLALLFIGILLFHKVERTFMDTV